MGPGQDGGDQDEDLLGRRLAVSELYPEQRLVRVRYEIWRNAALPGRLRSRGRL